MRIDAHGLRLELSRVTSLSEEDWCRVRAVAEVPGFKANVITYLQGADFRRFQEGIATMYGAAGVPKEVELSSHEPGILITLCMQRLGGIAGTYKFQEEYVEGGAPRLTGGFTLDQSYLPSISDGIAQLLAELEGP